MSGKARIGVIGAGWWAVVNHIPVLQAESRLRGRRGQPAGRGRTRGGAEPVRHRARLRGLPRDAGTVEMDGVVISSPHVLHFEHASAALAKGCHVLVEKPLTTNAADARALVAAAKAAGARSSSPMAGTSSRWRPRRRGWSPGRQDRACRPADGQRPRRPLRRPADAGDRRRDVPAAAIDLGRSETGRRLRLGATRPRARPPVPRRRSRAGARSSR